MATGLAILEGIGAAVGIAGGIKALSAKQPNFQAPKPTQPPQAASAPSVQNVKGAQAGTGQAGGEPGSPSTFLTGPGGVSPMSLMLGKKTLLGS